MSLNTLPWSWILKIFFLTSCTTETQTQVDYIPLQGIATLPKELRETSGLANCDPTSYYVHNDSGNKARIYQISASTGNILREVHIRGAKNHDWEELTMDEEYLYIGDFGNNAGLRKDLKIYRVNRSDLQKEEVEAQALDFTYPGYGSLKFPGEHNFDCEAMITIGDTLYLFSKNRGDLGTDVYRLPKRTDEFVAEHVGHFDAQGLITAADYRSGETPMLALLGYEITGNRYKSFLWIFRDFRGTDFFNGKYQRFEVAPNLQAEAILFESDSTLIITNEEERGGLGKMNRISIPDF